jgi:hypothetical protein
MRDARKFKLLSAAAALLCMLSVAYNMASEYILPDIEDYIKRRLYYEQVISKKGLSLHEAEYWRPVRGLEEGEDNKQGR